MQMPKRNSTVQLEVRASQSGGFHLQTVIEFIFTSFPYGKYLTAQNFKIFNVHLRAGGLQCLRYAHEG
jgi:hypothetical protein